MGFSEFVQSHGWKSFMSKVYGIGAAIVLIGAMFKIMHWPGAGIMLVVGLTTEAFIFFTSAFEPLHKEWDWSLVYPELSGIHDEIEDEELKKSGFSKKSALEKFDDLINNAQITPDLFEKLGSGLKNLNQTTEKLADVSQATIATNNYIASFEKASSKVSEFTEILRNSGQVINSSTLEVSDKLTKSVNHLSNTYESKAQLVDSSLTQFVEHVKNSGINFTEKIGSTTNQVIEQVNNSGNSLAQAYNQLTQIVNNEAEVSRNNAKNYTEQLQIMAKNLTALNAIYELQLQGSNEYLENSKKLFAGMDSIMQNMKDSVDDVKKYREEISKLGQNLAAMNTIYGNMLAAMNFNVNK